MGDCLVKDFLIIKRDDKQSTSHKLDGDRKGIWAKLTLPFWHQTLSFDGHATLQAIPTGLEQCSCYMSRLQHRVLQSPTLAATPHRLRHRSLIPMMGRARAKILLTNSGAYKGSIKEEKFCVA
jgi:hypothetical protein